MTALDALTVDVEPGIVGLVGANGAGKSTLIKILLGLIAPTTGGVRVLGMDPAKDGDTVRGRVGYMPEHDCLPPDLVAAEFVTHMARMSGLPATAARERASEALRHVGLYEERYRQVGGYSTGMKQRVKLAQALVHDPDLLLLDEPTNGLDPAGRDAMLTLIQRIGTSMTEQRDVLAIEVDEGTDQLAARLDELGLAVRREARLLLVPLESDETYDVILRVVAELDLPLHRLDQRRHRVAELFTDQEVPSAAR